MATGGRFSGGHRGAVAPVPYFTTNFTVGLDDLLTMICEELQISESRYLQAEERYSAVNKYLEAERSPFYAFNPRIYPQGSMRLNTTVKPIVGPHDLDFVLELGVSHEQVDPMKLLRSLYIYLRENEIYRPMISLKNRVVRIEYANEFYMDLLIACKNLSAAGTCVMVPDRQVRDWKHSNPRGYAAWFENRCALYYGRLRRVIDAAEPIPSQQPVSEKTPLQLAIQLFKRWRDLWYKGSDLAPISVVLTTMGAHHYSGERSVSETLRAILNGIIATISEADARFERIRVYNPSNFQEDLSEKWNNPEAYLAFRQGLLDLHQQWFQVLSRKGNVSGALEKLFGETVKAAFTKQARKLQEDRQQSRLGVLSAGSIVPASSTVPAVRPNTFYGQEK